MRLGSFYSLTVNCKFHLFSDHLLVICASDNMTQARMMKVRVNRLRCEAYLAYTMAEAVGHTDYGIRCNCNGRLLVEGG